MDKSSAQPGPELTDIPYEVLFVFPGLGKTTLAQTQPGWLDLDIGWFRSRKGNQELYQPFQRAIRAAWKEGYRILLNDPQLLPYVWQSGIRKIAFVLPNESAIARENRWSKATIRQFVEDWARTAQRYELPVFTVDYLADALVQPTGTQSSSAPDDLDSNPDSEMCAADAVNQQEGDQPTRSA